MSNSRESVIAISWQVSPTRANFALLMLLARGLELLMVSAIFSGEPEKKLYKNDDFFLDRWQAIIQPSLETPLKFAAAFMVMLFFSWLNKNVLKDGFENTSDEQRVRANNNPASNAYLDIHTAHITNGIARPTYVGIFIECFAYMVGISNTSLHNSLRAILLPFACLSLWNVKETIESREILLRKYTNPC